MSGIIIYCTCPDIATAEKISRQLVEAKLAACVNMLPGVTSIYAWQGKIEQSAEVLLLIKSVQERFVQISALIEDIHPYELPELIAVSIMDGLPGYLDWIKQCTTTKN
ncbi:MAG: divalent-cation tolerance protein CutA [Chromatiales bacterium]|jgi:periplasmic divalent cation tolerance protein